MLPWTNIETELKQDNFSGLRAIEIELMWQGAESIVLEPKLVTSERGDTYGRHIHIQPTTQLQKITVYIQDLKYYWSLAGGPTSTTEMNLGELKTVGLGIARKAQDQASKGILYIKAIRLMGTLEQ